MSEAALSQNQEEKQIAIFDCDIKSTEDDDRVLRFIGTTGSRDRYGDEISVKGWQLKNYMKNPVFLWAHNYEELPIGKAINIDKQDGGLLFDIKFAPAEINPKAEQVYQLYKHGYLKATSVGFRSLHHEWIQEGDEEKAERMKKEPDASPGAKFLKQELLELSAVPVPANPEALIQARKKGMGMPKELERELEKYFHTKGVVRRSCDEDAEEEDDGLIEIVDE